MNRSRVVGKKFDSSKRFDEINYVKLTIFIGLHWGVRYFTNQDCSARKEKIKQNENATLDSQSV